MHDFFLPYPTGCSGRNHANAKAWDKIANPVREGFAIPSRRPVPYRPVKESSGSTPELSALRQATTHDSKGRRRRFRDLPGGTAGRVDAAEEQPVPRSADTYWSREDLAGQGKIREMPVPSMSAFLSALLTLLLLVPMAVPLASARAETATDRQTACKEAEADGLDLDQFKEKQSVDYVWVLESYLKNQTYCLYGVTSSKMLAGELEMVHRRYYRFVMSHADSRECAGMANKKKSADCYDFRLRDLSDALLRDVLVLSKQLRLSE
jgi:hypothetical protein